MKLVAFKKRLTKFSKVASEGHLQSLNFDCGKKFALNFAAFQTLRSRCMHTIHRRYFVAIARKAILSCDVVNWTSPYGRQVSQESLQNVWRTCGAHYFSLALYELQQEARVCIVGVEQVFLTNVVTNF